MNFKRTYLLLTIFSILALACLTTIGCQPTPDNPDDQDPVVENGDGPDEPGPEGDVDSDDPESLTDVQGKPDETTDSDELPVNTGGFEPAEEFEFLVDLELLNENISDSLGKIESAIDGEAVEGGDARDDRNFLEELGLIQESIMAEADQNVVHASGVYRLSGEAMAELGGSLDSGTTEIIFPARFPVNRLAGYLFVANPGRIVEGIFDFANQMMNSDGSSPGRQLNIDMFLRMYGIQSTGSIYEWMSGELVILSLTNPGFNPRNEISLENKPFFTVLAISSDTPEDGIDLINTFMQVLVMVPDLLNLEEIQVVEEEFRGYEALIIHLAGMQVPIPGDPDSNNEMALEAEDLTVAAVNIPGYLLISNLPSLDAVLNLYNPDGQGTSRSVTIEAELDWDFLVENFNPDRTGSFVSLIDTSELRELVSDIYNTSRDFGDLDRARLSLTLVDTETIELDILASRESVRYFEAISEIIMETPEETWQAIGQRFGEINAPQSRVPMEMPDGNE